MVQHKIIVGFGEAFCCYLAPGKDDFRALRLRLSYIPECREVAYTQDLIFHLG